MQGRLYFQHTTRTLKYKDILSVFPAILRYSSVPLSSSNKRLIWIHYKILYMHLPDNAL